MPSCSVSTSCWYLLGSSVPLAAMWKWHALMLTAVIVATTAVLLTVEAVLLPSLAIAGFAAGWIARSVTWPSNSHGL